MSEAFVIKIDERWFDAIVSGNKTVEGKCLKAPELKSTARRIVEFYKENAEADSPKEVWISFETETKTKDERVALKQLIGMQRHSSIEQMLASHGLGNVLPGVLTLEEGVEIYRGYGFSEEVETTGVVAFLLG